MYITATYASASPDSSHRAPRVRYLPSFRINAIVHGKRAITADTALRLGRFFGTSAEFWMNLQAHYDLELQKDKLEAELDRVPVYAARN